MATATPDLPVIRRTVADIRALSRSWRAEGRSVAVVPTMGGLHDGHFALVRAAQAAADRVIVTIFVNPTQFAPTEDFNAYPRTEAEDITALSVFGTHAAFVPNAAEMYHEGHATSVSVAGPAEGLETDFRPHFFTGVATIVAKLFIATEADIALFGEKDYQQLLVVRRMAEDLGLSIDVQGLPTVREADGLALSSRNRYLSAEERATAPLIHRTLTATADAIRSGGDPAATLDTGRVTLTEAGYRLDYLELRNALTLAPPEDVASEPLRLLVAAHLGRTRLIDNIAV